MAKDKSLIRQVNDVYDLLEEAQDTLSEVYDTLGEAHKLMQYLPYDYNAPDNLKYYVINYLDSLDKKLENYMYETQALLDEADLDDDEEDVRDYGTRE